MFDDNLKTVGVSKNLSDPLRKKQQEDVEKMRTNLLSCGEDPLLVQTSLKNISVLRVYHQLSRIIRYTELMDKLESKLYESIEEQIDSSDAADPDTWMSLLAIQEKLQKNMIESSKLLEPYMDISDFAQLQAEDTEMIEELSLDAPKREKIRNSAQSVLNELNVG